ncbi:MAG TPA: hypothetical protein VFS43_11080 [Polyangiaceae bacterium]|nr:hypothetical protein [Polyangiaceae bacterium]
MTYRDGLGPRWRRACDELAFARERLERLPTRVRRRAPAGLRARLDAAPEPGWFDPTALAEVERAERAVAELRAALDEAEALAAEAGAAEKARDERAARDRARRAPTAVRGVRPPQPFELALLGPPPDEFAESAEELGRLLARYGAAPHWTAYQAVEVRFEREGASYALGLRRPISNVEPGPPVDTLSLSTDVPPTTPAFRLVPQTGFDDLLQSLRLQRRHRVGDEEFDVAFRIVGDAGCVRLFGPPVRASLLAVARVDVPSLEVGGGEATLRWRAPPSGALLESALRALAALRAGAP